MGQQINQYSLQRTSLGDDDYVDLDYFNGTGYETAKILGSDLKSSIAGEPNIQIITQGSDFPSNGILEPNTTYIINGQVTTNINLLAVTDEVALIGRHPNKDSLTFTGTGTFITVTECHFYMKNIRIKQNPNQSSGQIIEATNYTTGVPANNYGRTKVLSIKGCIFEEFYDIGTITGFELVDISDLLIWYVYGTKGLEFRDVRHLEIGSTECYNWYNVLTPTSYHTGSMITLLNNGADNQGFAVVNINTSIIHPEQTQIGLEIDPSSTTAFGTIASNTFIGVGLTTGTLFTPLVSGLPDYSQTYTQTFDVFANQGLLNSTSGVVTTMIGNTNDTTFSATSTPTIVAVGTGGAVPTLRASVRFSLDALTGRVTYNGTKQVYVSIHSSIAYEKQGGGGSNEYIFHLYKNGVQLQGSETTIDASSNAIGGLSLVYGVLVSQNDYIEVFVQNTTATNAMLVKDMQLVIRE